MMKDTVSDFRHYRLDFAIFSATFFIIIFSFLFYELVLIFFLPSSHIHTITIADSFREAHLNQFRLAWLHGLEAQYRMLQTNKPI